MAVSRINIFTSRNTGLTSYLAQMVVADVILAFVPASVIMHLNMDLKKRVNLSILLGLGLM